MGLDTGKAQPIPSIPSGTASTSTQKDPVNLVFYEYRDKDRYESVAYMPYYPAYALISFKSPACNAELTGFVDPFALKKNQLEITYQKCKISFDQQGDSISHPQESGQCQELHPPSCPFTTISQLKKVRLHLP